MSRKGLLPEADFYCDYPYTPLRFCTDDATDGLIERGSTGLLEEVGLNCSSVRSQRAIRTTRPRSDLPC
jgi:hypothetical protein